MIDAQQLESYMLGFFGYGDLHAPIWFVGMEEGGPSTEEEIAKRLRRWVAAGRRPMIDIVSEEVRTRNAYFASESAPIQRTWGKIIRATLIATDGKVSVSAIRAYQVDRFARTGSACSVIELMPLPAKNIATWPYAEFANLPYLASRKDYWNEISPIRIIALRNLIMSERPRAVVFLSKQYLGSWKQIVGKQIEWRKEKFGLSAADEVTNYFCVVHPTAFGTKNVTFEALGSALSDLIL